MAAHAYLLDTNVLLAALLAPELLPPEVAAGLADASNAVYFSAASIWEIAIKCGMGRGDMPVSGEDAVRYFQESGYRFLPIDVEHALAVESLPAHHQDPFDRILVAQALVEPMRLMTHDPLVARYSDTIIEV